MSEVDLPIGKRDRSPSFPYIGLDKAVERTGMLYAKARRHEVRISDAAKDWGLGPKSSATLQTVGALLAFGLIEDSGSGDNRKIKVSDLGWRVLEDQRPGVKDKLLAEAALKPKLIAEHYALWKDEGRPDDAHAVSQLKFDSGFTDEAANKFLRIYDETIRFTNEVASDKLDDSDETSNEPFDDGEPDLGGGAGGDSKPSGMRFLRTAARKAIIPMSGERELTTGLLSKEASFRLIVSGKIGEREIERLIKKLELDKEILADADEEASEKTVFE